MTFEQLLGSFYINDDLCNKAVYSNLLNNITKIVPVIGAGLSCWAGYPLWSDFLLQKSTGLPEQDEIQDLLKQSKYEEAASIEEQSYTTQTFKNILRKTFSPELLDENKRPHYQQLLPRVFSGPFLTTNYDVSLERILQDYMPIIPECRFDLNEAKRRARLHEKMLIKLHGTIHNPDHIILTAESYKNAYGKDPNKPDRDLSLPDVLYTVFASNPCLFLGCGLGPDRTCAVLSACCGSVGYALLELPEETENPDDPYHPILKDKNEYLPTLKSRREAMNSLGLDVIWYPYRRYEAVDTLITQLAKDMRLIPPSLLTEEEETIFYSGSEHYLGRDELEKDIIKKINDPASNIVLVHGVAGIGKTELCKAVYRQLKKERPELSMPFIDLNGIDSISAFLTFIADLFGISLKDIQPENTARYLYKEILDINPDFRNNIIFYLDNFESAWNNLQQEGKEKQLSEEIITLSRMGLHFLISSQVDIPIGHTITVGPLDNSIETSILSKREFDKLDRVNLFLKVLEREPKPEEYNALVSLTNDMNGHPLSIILTAKYGKQFDSLNDLLSKWHQVDIPTPDDKETHNSLPQALNLTWQMIRENWAATMRWAFHSLSLFPLDNKTLISLCDELHNHIPDKEWEEGEQLLYRYGLLTRDNSNKEIMLLAIKKSYANLGPQSEEATKLALNAWITWCSNLLKAGKDYQNPDHIKLHNLALTWLPECFYLADYCLDNQLFKELHSLLEYAGDYYPFDIALSLPLLSRLIDETPQRFELRRHFYKYRGDLYRRIGQFDKAKVNYHKAKTISARNHDQKWLAHVLHSQGDLFDKTDKTKYALKNYDKAQKLFLEEKDNSGLAYLFLSQGISLDRSNKTDKAFEVFNKAIKIFQSEKDSLGMAYVLLSRGQLSMKKNDLNQAMNDFKKAERIFSDEKDRHGKAHALRYKGSVYRKKGKDKEANSCYEEALVLYRQEQDSRCQCYMLVKVYKYKKKNGFNTEAEKCYQELQKLLPNQTEHVKTRVSNELKEV